MAKQSIDKEQCEACGHTRASRERTPEGLRLGRCQALVTRDVNGFATLTTCGCESFVKRKD